MIAGGHGEPNPNTSWPESRGFWLAYILGMLFVHLVLLSIPFVNVAFAWTITNVVHNLVTIYNKNLMRRISYCSTRIYTVSLVGSFIFSAWNQRCSMAQYKYVI